MDFLGPQGIITFDPDQTSYRQGCIAVVFAGMYFEAVTYLVAHLRGGRGLADQIGDVRRYGRKAAELGLRAEWIQEGCDRLQGARNDLVHEKCLDLNGKDDHQFLKTPSLQDEAEFAVGFVKCIDAILRGERPMEQDARLDGERGT